MVIVAEAVIVAEPGVLLVRVNVTWPLLLVVPVITLGEPKVALTCTTTPASATVLVM
jgi:hypothetical protein